MLHSPGQGARGDGDLGLNLPPSSHPVRAYLYGKKIAGHFNQIAHRTDIRCMSQSLASVVVHLIFSTKGREPVLDQDLRPELFSYLAALATSEGSNVYIVGGIEQEARAIPLF